MLSIRATSLSMFAALSLATGLEGASGAEPVPPAPDPDRLQAVARQFDEVAKDISPGGDLEAAIDNLDFEASRIVDFVRNAIRFEPYAGALKGAAGTLSAGAGNALDQALLLATLLRDAGFDARIVRGSLADAELPRLARAALQSPLAEGTSEGDAELGRQVESMKRLAVKPSSLPEPAARGQVGVPAARVSLTADRLAKLVSFDDAKEEFAQALRDYFWVEWRDGAGQPWRGAHPAFGPEDAPSELSATEYFAASIPEALQHRIRIEMGIERLESGRLVREPIAEAWERPVANFFGKSITVGVAPLRSAAADSPVTTFMPLFNGVVAPGGKAFNSLGQLVDMEAAANAAAGVFETVSGRFMQATGSLADSPSDQPLLALTGQYVRVSWIRPDGRVRTEERWPLDRLANRGASDEAPRLAPAEDGALMVKRLSYIRTYLVQAPGEHGTASLRRALDSAASRVRWSESMLRLLDWAEARLELEPSRAARISDDHPMLLALASFTHHPLQLPPGRTTWRDGPFVAALHQSLEPDVDSPMWLDIQFNPWRGGEVSPAGIAPWPEGSVLRGVLDTAWEAAVAAPEEDYLAVPAERIALLPSARNPAQRRDHAEGFVLASIPSPGMERWWRLHPMTGEVLGMSPLGGAINAEYIVTVISVGVGGLLMIRSAATCGDINDTTKRRCCYAMAAAFGLSGGAGLAAAAAASPIGMTVGAAWFSAAMQIKSMVLLDQVQSLATDAICN